MSQKFGEIEAVQPEVSGSPAFSLNGEDLKSVGRFIIHWFIGAVAAEIPMLMGLTYVVSVHGHAYDLTFVVVFVLGVISKIVTKYLTDHTA